MFERLETLIHGWPRDRTQEWGLWPGLRAARSALSGEVRRWIRAGCPSPAPGVIKLAIVRSYVKRYRVRRFIETGTFYGAMTDAIAQLGVQVDTIELNEVLATRARRIFYRRQNVTVHQGDSAIVLPGLLDGLKTPAVFWLDAHWSGGITARGEVDTPISSELAAILDHPCSHVVLIDDARHFTGKDGYPELHELIGTIAGSGRYHIEISTDIIRCVGKELASSIS